MPEDGPLNFRKAGPAGLSDFRAFRSDTAYVAAGERTSLGHCGRQFHRSLDTLGPALEDHF